MSFDVVVHILKCQSHLIVNFFHLIFYFTFPLSASFGSSKFLPLFREEGGAGNFSPVQKQ